MKNFFCFLIIALTLTSCDKIYSSGNIVTETYSLNDYGKYHIKVGGAFELVLTDYLPDYEYEIMVDDNILKYISVEDINNKLTITLDEEVDNKATLKIYVSSSTFDMITASGVAIVVNEDDDSFYDNYYITLSGSASYIGAVNSDYLFLTQSGSSECDITSGSSYKSYLVMSGSSSLFCNLAFESSCVELNMKGSSEAQMVVTDIISGDMSGSSSFKNRGGGDNVDVNVELTGSAKIEN